MVEILRTTKRGDKVHCGTPDDKKKKHGEEGLVCERRWMMIRD